MSKIIIRTPEAPSPIGPYNQAVQTENLLFISGQIGMDPVTQTIATGDVPAQTRQIMQNLEAILRQAGLGFEHVVKTTIYLTDMEMFGLVNEVYGSCFSQHYPARETVAVQGLPRGVQVEISMIATLRL